MRVAIVGATSWGRTLARLFAAAGSEVLVWARSDEEAARTEAALRGVAAAGTDARALGEAALVVYAVPSESLEWNLDRTLAFVSGNAVILSAIKGIRPQDGLRVSQVIAGFGVQADRIAVLSGPNLSAEIEAGMPAASVVACVSEERARLVQAALHGPTFRVYTSSDLVGVELAGALKNVAAIACGISDGLGFGANARAGLMTRALAEMTRLGVVLGGRPSTFFGLAGVGDLIATCHSDLSRNRRVGIALAQGVTLAQALASVEGVAEGVPTTAAACRLARQHGVEMPIAAELHEVLFAGKSATAAMKSLLSRAATTEFPAALSGGV